MSRILAVVDGVSEALAWFSAALIVVIASLILGEVSLRYIFNTTIPFAWEYAAYCNGAAIFCGAAFTMRTGGHVRVTLLSSSVRPLYRRMLDILATIIGLGAAGFLTYGLVQLASRAYQTGLTSATNMETPLIYPQGAIALGAVLLCLQLVARLVRLLIGEPPDHVSAEDGFTVE